MAAEGLEEVEVLVEVEDLVEVEVLVVVDPAAVEEGNDLHFLLAESQCVIVCLIASKILSF